MQSEVNQKENLNRIITVPNLLSFFRLCLIPVIIWSYCIKKNPLLAGEILLLSGLTDLALICIPLYNETLRGCFTVGEKKKHQKNDD